MNVSVQRSLHTTARINRYSKVNSALIAKLSRTDLVISQVIHLVQEGGLERSVITKKVKGQRQATFRNKAEPGER